MAKVVACGHNNDTLITSCGIAQCYAAKRSRSQHVSCVLLSLTVATDDTVMALRSGMAALPVSY